MHAVNEPSNATAGVEATQSLSFMLGSEEYAIDILRVREIRGVCAITPVPNAPPAVLVRE